jgi:hypothetical protein
MIKSKKSLKDSKIPSRRKFFKAAAVTGALMKRKGLIPIHG